MISDTLISTTMYLILVVTVDVPLLHINTQLESQRKVIKPFLLLLEVLPTVDLVVCSLQLTSISTTAHSLLSHVECVNNTELLYTIWVILARKLATRRALTGEKVPSFSF